MARMSPLTGGGGGVVDPITRDTKSRRLTARLRSTASGSSGAKWMDTSVTLFLEGKYQGIMRIITITQSDVDLVGFTGTVQVDVLDNAGNIVATSPERRYGVDGAFLGDNSRRDEFRLKITDDAVEDAASLQIIHDDANTNRVGKAILKEIFG